MLEVRRSEANLLNRILRRKKTTVHHLLEAADSYMLTMTIAKLLLHSRQEMSSGRFSNKEGSQPKVKRQPEGNVNRGSCHSFHTTNKKQTVDSQERKGLHQRQKGNLKAT
jgi:hypothetical protein